MSRTIRILLLGLVSALALSSAGTALAAFNTPRLVVSDAKPVGSLTINYTQSATDDPVAKLTFYAAPEYNASVTRPAGTTIGTVTAQGTAADLGGALLPLTGTVQVRAANGTYLSGSTQVPIAAAATQCTGTATHTAFWVLILQAAGQTLELPVFVDSPAAPPRAGVDASQFASASIQACLPPPDVPAGTPGRATFGFKLTQVAFRVNSVFTTAGTGQPLWRVLAIPYTPNTGRPNAAGSVEAQSVVAFPRSVVLSRPSVRVKSGIATLAIRGNVLAPGGLAAVSVRLFRGSGPSATVRSIVLRRSGRTVLTGTLRIRQTTKRQTLFLKIRGSIAAGTTTCTATFGVPCLSNNRAAVALSSNSVRVLIPARKR
ncbi:MAG: hypothetical protein M3R12_04965 [Actinomycetota bacterium]|nr:hypothetical protein [Actinomycetota bacterium]